MKTCPKCKIIKELIEFNKQKSSKDGLQGHCKMCQRENNKQWNNRHPNINSNRCKEYRKKNPMFSKLHNLKNNSKIRKLAMELTDLQAIEIFKQPCHYCGKEGLNGIDRKDNSVGYILENCLPCCENCNKAKLTRTYDDFKSWINKCYHNLNK